MEILNLGCGKTPFKNTLDISYFNMDNVTIEVKDLAEGIIFHKRNILKIPYPLIPDHFDRCYLFHTIEHIPEDKHRVLLREIYRVLKPGGMLIVSYPEFIKVAKNYIENKAGKRDFWARCIYGRGLNEWDRHKALMNTEYFVKVLREIGLIPEKISPEKSQSFNTVILCKKGEPMLSYEKLLGEEFASNV